MTSRVFDCHAHRRPKLVDHAPLERSDLRRSRWRGVQAVLLSSLVLVPVAGASEPAGGWALTGLAAVLVLGLAWASAGRGPWGWLALLLALAAVILPRGPLPQLGPALCVAAGLCLVLWLAERTDGGRRLRAAARRAQLQQGLDGERQVSAVLARELPDDYVLINGLALPYGAGDVDHVVLGPTGVFVLETKTMAGRIVCNPDGTWHRTKFGRGGTAYDGYIGNPGQQVQRNILTTRNALRRRLPALFGTSPLWIEGLVVFPHPETQLEADQSRVPALRLEQVVDAIQHHTPRRPLSPAEVDDLLAALLGGSADRGQYVARSAQALVELALVLPVVLGLVLGTVALSRVVQAQTAVVAVAHEGARAAALAASPDDAVGRLQQRASVVAAGLGLDPAALDLSWDVSHFGRDQGEVLVGARYRVDLSDLPLLGWSGVPAPEVTAQHVEWVDPFRSGIQ
jgi:hypothetical protein